MAKIAINEFARKAYEKYLAAGMTAEGACGLMGNQYAESAGFIANRMEFLLKSLLKIYTDETYTAAVDCGKISREGFLHPLPGKQYGYGLCQWTSPGRKAGLYDLAKKRGVSIGDEDLAIDYTLMELEKSYPSTLKVLKSARTVKEASDYVLIHFESPADCGAAVKNTRADYAQQYYDYFKKLSSVTESSGKQTAESYLDIMRKWIGYSEANGQFREIIDIYNSHRPLARGYAVKYTDEWCDTTVSAAGIKAGCSDLIGRECGCEEHVKIFKQLGIWNEDGTIVPKPGYIIVYSWRTSRQPNDAYSDHIGVVESTKNGLITVIEGNKDEEVGRRVIPVGWGYIRGYAMPRYDKAGTGSGNTPVNASGNTATSTSGQKPAVNGADDGRISYKPQWVGKCTADTLNVRVWAGTGYPNIKSWPVLAEGNLVDVCDSVKGTDGQAWYFVRIAGQYFGFVHSAYIRKI